MKKLPINSAHLQKNVVLKTTFSTELYKKRAGNIYIYIIPLIILRFLDCLEYIAEQ